MASGAIRGNDLDARNMKKTIRLDFGQIWVNDLIYP